MSDTVTLSRAEHSALLERIEELEDIVAALRAEARVAAGEGEYLPAEMVRRLALGAESPIKVWRDHRGMTATQLATAAGIAKSYLSELESGAKAGSVDVLRRLARVLRTDLDDLVPAESSAEA
jgi:DNA-binding XRE family transcriptional regulator